MANELEAHQYLLHDLVDKGYMPCDPDWEPVAGGDTACPVCLEDYSSEFRRPLAMNNCKHRICQHCFSLMLKESCGGEIKPVRCPLCLKPMEQRLRWSLPRSAVKFKDYYDFLDAPVPNCSSEEEVILCGILPDGKFVELRKTVSVEVRQLNGRTETNLRHVLSIRVSSCEHCKRNLKVNATPEEAAKQLHRLKHLYNLFHESTGLTNHGTNRNTEDLGRLEDRDSYSKIILGTGQGPEILERRMQRSVMRTSGGIGCESAPCNAGRGATLYQCLRWNFKMQEESFLLKSIEPMREDNFAEELCCRLYVDIQMVFALMFPYMKTANNIGILLEMHGVDLSDSNLTANPFEVFPDVLEVVVASEIAQAADDEQTSWLVQTAATAIKEYLSLPGFFIKPSKPTLQNGRWHYPLDCSPDGASAWYKELEALYVKSFSHSITKSKL